MSWLKRKAQAGLRAAIGDHRRGLSSFGKLSDRFARHILFHSRALSLTAGLSARPEKTEGEEDRFTDTSLVYDLGANNGDDVEYYLTKGLRVVAVEAMPALAEGIRVRFAQAISDRRLVVLNVALTDGDQSSLDFYVHVSNDKISSVLPPLEAEKHLFNRITVPARRLPDIIREYGDPTYLKIDIEGLDQDILKDVFATGLRPQYVSAESHSIEVLCHMVAAGYRRFKVVEGQFVETTYRDLPIATLQGPTKFSFREHSAGPFGSDLPGPWLSPTEMFKYLSEYGLGWKDIHAAR